MFDETDEKEAPPMIMEIIEMFSEESENDEPPVMEMMEMLPEEEEKEEPPM